MSREVVYIRGNGRSSRVTKSDAVYTGFVESTEPIGDQINDWVDTTTPTGSDLVLTSGTLYNNVYIAASWTSSPDPEIAGYNVTFNRDSGQSISTYRVDTGSAYHEPAVAGSSYVVTVSNVYINGVLGTQILQDTIIAATDTTVPATPTGLSLGTGIRSITISWDENTEPDMEFGLGQYRVQLSNDGTFSGADIIRDKVVGALVTTFADLLTDVQYWARVAAVDTSGNESTFSASVNGTTGEVQGTDIADLAVTNAKIADATIESAKIVELNADKIVAGTGFVNVLTVNSGGSIESANYDNVGPTYDGWKIDNNSAVFNNVTVRGTLDSVVGTFGLITGGQLEIAWTGSPTPTSGLRVLSTGALDVGGLDSTSWHVDSTGNMWWGSSTTYAGATNKISNTGSIDFTTGTFSGTLDSTVMNGGQINIGGSDSTSWHVDTAGNMWWGSAGSYAAASIKISSSGSVNFTTGNFSGTLSSGISITSPVITGGTITGSTVQTASSGQRVVMSSSGNDIQFYGSTGTYVGEISGGISSLFQMNAASGSNLSISAAQILMNATAVGGNVEIVSDSNFIVNGASSAEPDLIDADASAQAVGINWNSATLGSPVYNLHVAGTFRASSTTSLGSTIIGASSGTVPSYTLDVRGSSRHGSSSTHRFYAQSIYDNPNPAISAISGNVWIDSNTFGYRVMRASGSSAKIKTDVEDMDPNYAKLVYNIRPVWYRGIKEKANGDFRSTYGIIAEELAEVDPRLVVWDHDPDCNCEEEVPENSKDFDGYVDDGYVKHVCEKVPVNVEYGRLIVHLIWAVKDHVKRIEELETQVAALQGAV